MKYKSPLALAFLFSMLAFCVLSKDSSAQACSGQWVRDQPLTFQCISGQQIGHNNNFGNPTGCPANPIYNASQTNTFNFAQPINDFFIDFNGFGSSPNCAKMQVKINNVAFLLTSANVIEFSVAGTTCTGSLEHLAITADGYLTCGAFSGSGSGINVQGRLTFQNVNASSITISTNDGGLGSIFANPCAAVLPVKLLSLFGSAHNCIAKIRWETALE